MERTKLYEHLTEGAFFTDDRVFTKRCIEQILTDVPFNETDLDALDSIEVLAPASEELAVIMPARSVPSVWFSPMLENEPPEIAKRKICWALACAIAIGKGLEPDQVITDAKYSMRRWGFPATEGAAA